MAYEIRNLGLGGILDSTFRLLREHFKFIVIVTGVLYFPLPLVIELSQAVLSPNTYLADTTIFGEPETPDGIVPRLDGEPETPESAAAGLIGTLEEPVLMILGALMQGALAYGLAMRIRGRNIRAADAIRVALRRSPGLVGLNIIYLIGVAVGCVFLLVPGIIFAMMWFVIVPAYMIERVSLGKAFSRSAAIMKGQKNKAFNVCILLVIVTLGGLFIAFIIPNAYVVAILYATVDSMYRALFAIAATVIYFSSRCANENLDLELLAASMEAQQPQEAISPL